MSILRRSRLRTISIVGAITVVLTLALALVASSYGGYGGELGQRTLVFVAALGIATVMIVLFQEVTDRLERH